MRQILLFITTILLFSACNSSDITQSKYRNPDYIWFVNNNSKQGKWINISDDKLNPTLKDGHCTLFYKNGAIREKYNLNNKGNTDTTFYYNLSEQLSHYSINENKKTKNYFLKEGYFEAFSADEKIIVKGSVKDNQLDKFNFEGNLKNFQDLNASSTKVSFLTNKLVNMITKAFTLRQKADEPFIPENTTKTIEETRIQIIKFNNSQIEKINSYVVDNNLNELKSTTVKFIEKNNNILNKQFETLVQAMKKEFTDENLNEMTTMSLGILKTTAQADKMLEQEQLNVSKQINLADYLVPLFEQKKNDILNQ